MSKEECLTKEEFREIIYNIGLVIVCIGFTVLFSFNFHWLYEFDKVVFAYLNIIPAFLIGFIAIIIFLKTTGDIFE